jgi:aminoglycoside 6'-N-acetyltransferase I
MSIRVAGPDDLPGLLELAVAFYAEDGFATSRERLADHLAHLVPSGSARVAVVAEGAAPVAFGITTTTYGLEDGLVAELEDLFVAPPARRRGLAAELIADSARWARQAGAARLEVVIAPNGMDASHLFRYYERRGFVDEDRRLLAMPL